MTRENNIKNFLREYKELCKKYNVSLGHEDEYGGFILYEYDEDMIEWVEAASDDVQRKQEDEKRRVEQELRFNEYYELIQQMLSEGLNIVETERGYVHHVSNKGFEWVSAVFKILDNEGNEVREATRNEKGMAEFIAMIIRGHELFYEHHKDGMNINMKDMVEWYNKYK